jgi:hypothetical protein
VELFNLIEDPYERRNLAETQPEKLDELKKRYNELASQAVRPKNPWRPEGFEAPKVWGESGMK